MMHQMHHTGDVRRIAIFRALFLGDLLCTTPAFRALKRRFPGAEITLIGLPWARAMVERLPDLDRFEPFPGYDGIMETPYDPARTAAFFAAARARGYDLALQMHGAGEVSNGFVAGLGARVTAGYRRGGDDRLTLSLPYDFEEHEVRRWLRLGALVGTPTDDTRLDFPIAPAEHARAAALLAATPGTTGSAESAIRNPQSAIRIGLHPGAKDPARRWPVACFAALGDALAGRHGARIVLTGGAGERAITAAVRRAMRAPALDLAGATDLGSFAAVLARLDLLVTNDTGASHLAAATGTPSVVLFGPSRPAEWAPLDRGRHRTVDALALAGPGGDPATVLRDLPVEPVLAACAAALDARPATCGPRPSTCDPRPVHAED